MAAATIIFPHQLFKQHPAVHKARKVYLVEEDLFFNQFNFHKMKLVLHRATMKVYAEHLQSLGVEVQYIAAQENICDVRLLIAHLHQQGITEVHVCDPADYLLHRRLKRLCRQTGIALQVHRTPNFLNSMDEVAPFFDKKRTYFQTAFYTAQRKQRKILLDSDGGPEGGHWTFDADNRKKYPKKQTPPALPFAAENKYVQEARTYVDEHYPNNYGSHTPFFLPVDFDGAEKWLETFFEQRFTHFGIYEDAIVANEHFLHHSVISPLLNCGLLNPHKVIADAIGAAARHQVPLNSTEGFIRQVMGWREFIRIVYEREGSRQRTKNYWGFTRKIPASFWQGTTGIVPVDSVVNKVLKIGYSHHIERLMVMGNFMLLCEFDPNDVYKWFMEMYIDAYDWVMVPNVYGMTQFADGGLMMTKPYISSSNYLMKMSDYKKGDWTAIWDALFWRFMHVHRNFFEANPRLQMLLGTLDKMAPEKRQAHLDTAERYLLQLDNVALYD